MAPINCISSVYIRADQETLTLVRSEDICLVCTRVRPQNCVFIDIVGICLASSWMVERKSERVEVLVGGYDGEEGVVVLVGWVREAGFDDCAGYSDGVVFLYV